MRRNHFWIAGIGILALLLLLPVVSSAASPPSKEKVIYSFQGGTDGTSPLSDLILDSAGNLYGTTGTGGSGKACGNSGCGTVFELMRTQGGWKEQVLYRFAGDSDGAGPVAGLIFDAAGNLYGTTTGGGNGGYAFGTVFKLTPNSKGGWTHNIIYTFDFSGSAGIEPASDLALDAQGNLYGTTPHGAIETCNNFDGCGAVFELTPLQNGTWMETTIHQFSGSPDGALPSSGLILDSAGNFYGMTQYGGTGRCASNRNTGCGTIYKLTSDSHGGWTETVVYNFAFGGGFGIFPLGGLILDEAGDLFATSQAGGDGLGIVFQLHDSQKVGWQQNVLHRFFGAPLDGRLPLGLVENLRGDLFGVTEGGGAHQGGMVFELEHAKGGKEEILHSFAGPPDGANPVAGLVRGSHGHMYGTTRYGGTATACSGGCGTVYEAVP
jgi:hypothetical protein